MTRLARGIAQALPTALSAAACALFSSSLPSYSARPAIAPIIASGGLNSVADIQAVCARLAPEGVIGAIAGRALYEGKLELKSAQAAADKAVGKA